LQGTLGDVKDAVGPAGKHSAVRCDEHGGTFLPSLL